MLWAPTGTVAARMAAWRACVEGSSLHGGGLWVPDLVSSALRDAGVVPQSIMHAGMRACAGL
jgi:hypothetical protein